MDIYSVLIHTYWYVGREIVEFEQKGKKRAEYGGEVIKRLSIDLTKQFGKGFSADNLDNTRNFYSSYLKSETLSRKSIHSKKVLEIKFEIR